MKNYFSIKLQQIIHLLIKNNNFKKLKTMANN